MWRSQALWTAFNDELEKIAAGVKPVATRPPAPKVKIRPQQPQVPGYNSAYAMGGVTPPQSPVLPPIAGESSTLSPLTTGVARPMPSQASLMQNQGLQSTGASPSLMPQTGMPNTMNPLTQGAQPPMSASGPMMMNR